MTITEVKTLNDLDLRFEVAKYFYNDIKYHLDNELIGMAVTGDEVTIPHYESDLNAMYKLEQNLTYAEYLPYSNIYLSMIWGESSEFIRLISSSSRQRAQGYLWYKQKSKEI